MNPTEKDKARQEFMDEIKSDYILYPKKKVRFHPTDATYEAMNAVVGAIEDLRGHSLEMLRSKDRKYKLPESRHIFCWVMSHLDDTITWHTIAMHIGKNHATAMHGYRNVENWMETNRYFRRQMMVICSMVVERCTEVNTERLKKHIAKFNDGHESTDSGSRKLG